MSQINVQNLTLSYDGQPIVRDLSFQVEKGDYLLIIGENGTGKSTLVKSLLGLLKGVKGNISFGDGAKRGSIGYLPQQQVVQGDFPASVKEVVMSAFAGKTIFPLFSKHIKKKAKEKMKLLNISGLSESCFRELSGGQQQRTLLARALCATDDLLLLDEPVNSLDPKASSEMYKIINDLNRKGMTIIMVTHDIKSAISFSNRVLHLSHDSYWFGPTADYLTSGYGDNLLKGEKI